MVLVQPHFLRSSILCEGRWRSFARRSVVGCSIAMAKPRVLQLGPAIDYLEESLKLKFEHIAFWKLLDKEGFLTANGAEVRGVVMSSWDKLSTDLLSKLPNLEIVSCFSVGVDSVDLVACKERKVIVTNTPDVLTDDTSDIALALMLATMRRIVPADRYVREGRWSSTGCYPLSYKMSGKRVGIVGLGRIGQAIATRAEAFGCRISYYARSDKHAPYTYYGSVVELARNSDILVVATALTKETTHIVDRQVLDALGPQGTLVNIARGPVVDETELVKALVEGRILGAGLDVYEKEPHVPEELLSLDNVVLQPHVGSGTWETRRAMADVVLQNLVAHFSGNNVLNPVI